MPSLRRPTTFRTLNRSIPATTLSYRRIGEAPFPSLERTTIVRTRRAKGFVTTPKVALGRDSNRADSRFNDNPSGFMPGRVIIRRGIPGKELRTFGPALSRWGIPLGRI